MRSITLKALYTLLITALMGVFLYWVGTLPPIHMQNPTDPLPSTTTTTIPTQTHSTVHSHNFDTGWTSDDQFHWNTCTCGNQANVSAHTDANGDLSCDTCLAPVSPLLHKHHFTATWDKDETEHWHNCLCGERNDVASHIDLDGNQTCDVCETAVSPSLHQHNFGANWYFFENYHWRSCLCGETIDTAPHTDLDGNEFCDTCETAVPSSLHQHLFGDDWASNDDTHWHNCLCGEQSDNAPHEDANGDRLCDICEAAVSPTLHQHLYATEWSFDETEHWHSCLCGQRDDVAGHEDNNGDEICDICANSVSASLHQHSFGTGWNSDAQNHWHSCLCGEQSEVAPHTDANGDELCDICSASVSADLHQHLFGDDWVSNDDTHWHSCLCGEQNDVASHTDVDGDVRCDTCEAAVSPLLHQHSFDIEWKTSEDNHWHSCLCGEQSEVAPHTDVNGDQLCDTCSASVSADLHQHLFGDDWTSNEDNHWHSCLCGEQIDAAPHTDVNGDELCDTCEITVGPTLHQHGFDQLWLSDTVSHWKICICGEPSESEAHIDEDGNSCCDVCQYILLSSSSAFIYDLSKEEYVYHNQPLDLTVYPASITKLFTCYVALQYLDDISAVITLGEEVALIESDASQVYLDPGDHVSIDFLLHASLMRSGADATYALAAAAGYQILGDPNATAQDAIAAFKVRMNEIAGELNMSNTNFVTLDGYHDDAHIISYNDLIILAKCAMDNEIIRTICGKKEATLHYIGASGKEYDVVYTNSNDLLQDSSPYYIPECIGLKTGYTNKAGICFLGAFRQGETDVIIGVFGAPDSDQRWQDMHTLWNYYLEQQTPGNQPGVYCIQDWRQLPLD